MPSCMPCRVRLIRSMLGIHETTPQRNATSIRYTQRRWARTLYARAGLSAPGRWRVACERVAGGLMATETQAGGVVEHHPGIAALLALAEPVPPLPRRPTSGADVPSVPRGDAPPQTVLERTLAGLQRL